MENNNYNSLTDRLIQNGIIANTTRESQNFFEAYRDESIENNSDSPFAQKPEKADTTDSNRINEYDQNLIRKKSGKNHLKMKKKLGLYDSFLLKFFPKLYRAKLVKQAMKRISDLNIDTALLFNKTIPYGESEIRYGDLIKYLVCANELQIELSDD